MAALKVNIDGRQRPCKCHWQDYWGRHAKVIRGREEELLDRLRVTRARYIRKGFSLQFAGDYCHAYFSLLESAINARSPSQLRFLHAVLAFENTVVQWPDQAQTSAAVTSTARNPVYLLAKLRTPLAYDDPKFLPLLTVGDADEGPSSLYFHYRQIKLASNPAMSLLLYPAADLSTRVDSFSCLQMLAVGLERKRDPRSASRAELIAKNAVLPFFEECAVPSEAGADEPFSLVDLGGGSGAVLRSLASHLLTSRPKFLADKQLSFTVVDVKPSKPLWSQARRRFHQRIELMKWVQSDYRRWIHDQDIAFDRQPIEVILLCRVINNLSNFKISWSNDWSLIDKLSQGKLREDTWRTRRFLPQSCLSRWSSDRHFLLTSNSRLALNRGATFCQLSLTDYFRGLSIRSTSIALSPAPGGSIFFPVRQFNPTSLELPGGGSVVSKLARLGRLVVLEDVDLYASDLRRHCEEHGLSRVAVSDATNRSQMRSARLLCIADKSMAEHLPGIQVW